MSNSILVWALERANISPVSLRVLSVGETVIELAERNVAAIAIKLSFFFMKLTPQLIRNEAVVATLFQATYYIQRFQEFLNLTIKRLFNMLSDYCSSLLGAVLVTYL